MNIVTGKTARVVTPEPAIIVTPDGVALPKGAVIPSNYIENQNRQVSYGVKDANGRFQEMLRIDPGTPSGMKGPNESHFHLNGSEKHTFDINKWPWWR